MWKRRWDSLLGKLHRLVRRQGKTNPMKDPESDIHSFGQTSNLTTPPQLPLIESPYSENRPCASEAKVKPSSLTTIENQHPNSLSRGEVRSGPILFGEAEERQRRLRELFRSESTEQTIYQCYLRDVRLPGTGRWFWDIVEKWLNEPYSSVLLCWGMRTLASINPADCALAGSGRTVLTYLCFN